MTAPAYDPVETAWSVREADFPHDGTAARQHAFLLRYATLAPSSHNSQPWRFACGCGDAGDEVAFYVDRSRWLRVADADQRELHISVGCALENFLVAAEHFGFAPRVDYFPEPANEYLAAKVTLAPGGAPTPPRDRRLFDAIAIRHTNHETYEDRPIPPGVLRQIAGCVVEPDLALFTTDDRAVRRTVDDLVIKSDALQFADPAYREELAHWIAQGVFGTPWLMAQLARLAVAYVNLGSTYAQRDSDVLMSAPVLALLSSSTNDRRSQVRAGQAFERICLMAALLGVGVRPMSQVLEIPEHKERIAGLLGPGHPVPQQTFLLGFAPPADKRTPRRSVEETAV